MEIHNYTERSNIGTPTSRVLRCSDTARRAAGKYYQRYTEPVFQAKALFSIVRFHPDDCRLVFCGSSSQRAAYVVATSHCAQVSYSRSLSRWWH